MDIDNVSYNKIKVNITTNAAISSCTERQLVLR